jgi:hypothetical protein
MESLYVGLAVFIASAVAYLYYTKKDGGGQQSGVPAVSPPVLITPGIVVTPGGVVAPGLQKKDANGQSLDINNLHQDAPAVADLPPSVPTTVVPATNTTQPVQSVVYKVGYDSGDTRFRLFKETDFPGNDVLNYAHLPHYQCSDACVATTNCIAYTLNRTEGRETGCWLKYKLENKTLNVPDRDTYVLNDYATSEYIH